MDIADRLLALLRDDFLKIDAEWCAAQPDGFDWWPHDLRQRVRLRRLEAATPEEAGVLLTVETDIVRSVPLEEASTYEVLNRANQAHELSILALGEDGVVRLRFALRIFEDIYPWASKWAVWLSACQVADSADLADYLLRSIPTAVRASTGHPENGRRPDVDSIVDVRDFLGQQSRDLADAMPVQAIAEGLSLVTGARAEPLPSGGFAVDQKWQVDFELEARWAKRGQLRTIASVIDSPEYGPSVAVLTWPAYAPPPELALSLCMALNDISREDWVRGSVIGTWTAQESEDAVAVRTVLPAAMCATSGVEDLAASIANVAIYQAQQCTLLPIAVQAMVGDLTGPDPFVVGTRAVS